MEAKGCEDLLRMVINVWKPNPGCKKGLVSRLAPAWFAKKPIPHYNWSLQINPQTLITLDMKMMNITPFS